MPGPNMVLDKGMYPDAASNSFKCQKLVTTAKEHVTEAGAGEPVFGVLQETVSSDDVTNGRVANIRVMGISRCIADGAITIGDKLEAGATGYVSKATATTAKQYQVGIALTTVTTAGDHIDVLLTPGVQIDT